MMIGPLLRKLLFQKSCTLSSTKQARGISKLHLGNTTTLEVSQCNNNIIQSPYIVSQISHTTIPQFVFENFERHPHKIAVECCLTARKYTFEQLQKASKNFGKALRKKFKLKKGDVIALIIPNIPEFPICLLGALDAGLVVTAMNSSYKPVAIDNSQVTILVSLDFSKAFDMIHHEPLIAKLYYYGCDPIAIKWFTSYLSDRSHSVKVNGQLSGEIVLTPTIRGNSTYSINLNVSAITPWAKTSGLCLNSSKFTAMCIGSSALRQKALSVLTNSVCVDGVPLVLSECIKNLDVYLGLQS